VDLELTPPPKNKNPKKNGKQIGTLAHIGGPRINPKKRKKNPKKQFGNKEILGFMV
jgi:hypothetical protein